MGLRFRKSLKVAPGVKLNLNKNSASVTFGGKGVHYTVNSKGKQTKTVSVPGTGINYSTTSGGTTDKSTASPPPTDTQSDYLESSNIEPPNIEPDNSNKPKKGCLTYLLYFLILGIALAIYSYVWIPGIIAIVYFAVKKAEPKLKKKRILISTGITISSLLVSS